MEKAAVKLYALGPAYVLIKGGHLVLQEGKEGGTIGNGVSNGSGSGIEGQDQEVVDVLYDGRTFEYIRGPRVATSNVHGTGCTLSSAIAAELARGATVLQVHYNPLIVLILQIQRD